MVVFWFKKPTVEERDRSARRSRRREKRRLTVVAELGDGLGRVVHIPDLDHVIGRAPVDMNKDQPQLFESRRTIGLT